MNFAFLRNVALKGFILFILLALVIGAVPASALGRVSIYNRLVPGRPRLPFGETPQRSYNLSLYNLDAMFASHEISGQRDDSTYYRIFLLGDSSVWGTLLRPEETLSGQLNALDLQICGKPARFYNLGYPTISLVKDVLIMRRALPYHPDMIIWLTTLEAFPLDKQYASPLAENNRAELQPFLGSESQADLKSPGLWDNTLFGRRRELADWARLQLYAIPWATSGIDQDYPQNFSAADIDLEADDTFHELKPGDDISAGLAWDVLQKGMDLITNANLPVLLVNEPILISNGENSDIRYNFFYPHWAYDVYRSELNRRAETNGWYYLDAWDVVEMEQFTNSAIHLTPEGEKSLANSLAVELATRECH